MLSQTCAESAVRGGLGRSCPLGSWRGRTTHGTAAARWGATPSVRAGQGRAPACGCGEAPGHGTGHSPPGSCRRLRGRPSAPRPRQTHLHVPCQSPVSLPQQNTHCLNPRPQFYFYLFQRSRSSLVGADLVVVRLLLHLHSAERGERRALMRMVLEGG